MASDENPWRIGPEGLISNGAVLSFQRFRRPADGIVHEAPPSCGVLPAGYGRSGLLLAVPRDEAFWIGVLLDASWSGELAIAVERIDRTMISLARIGRLGASTIDGIPRHDGRFDVFCSDTILAIQLDNGAVVCRIEITSVEDFVARTGRKPPSSFNAGTAYQGWRLP
jgi:hypothetical protein